MVLREVIPGKEHNGGGPETDLSSKSPSLEANWLTKNGLGQNQKEKQNLLSVSNRGFTGHRQVEATLVYLLYFHLPPESLKGKAIAQ